MIETEIVRDDYLGNGATAIYDYTFKIFDQSHLKVIVRTTDNIEHTLTLGTDYSVSGTGDAGGGSVTLTSSGQVWITGGFLTSGLPITLIRNIPNTQTIDVKNQGDFLPEIHEIAFDKMVMMIQQLNNILQRSLKVAETDYTSDLPFPTAAERAGLYLGFDLSGNPVALAGAVPTALTVSTYIQTLLLAATATVARTTLGFTGAGATVATANIADGAVTTVKIPDANITTAKILDANITTSKLATGVAAGLTAVTIASDDYVVTSDTSDSGKIKKSLVSDIKNSVVRYVITYPDIATSSDSTLIYSGTSGSPNLPSAVLNSGKTMTVIHAGTSLSQTYTVGAVAGNVAGSATSILYTNGEALTVKSDGTDWVKVSRYIPATKTSYTPSGSWVSNAAYTGSWQRFGKRCHAEVLVTLSGAPTATALTVALPANITIKSSELLSTGTGPAGIPLGIGYAYDLSATISYRCSVKYVDASNVSQYVTSTATPAQEAATSSTVTFTAATGDLFYLSFDFPVTGWND